MAMATPHPHHPGPVPVTPHAEIDSSISSSIRLVLSETKIK
jgi:hypothetical protein